MILGFHIPLWLHEEQIKNLGDRLLGEEGYQWIEIKYPENIPDYSPEGYIRGINYLIDKYNPGVSLHVPTILDIAINNTGLRDEVFRQIKNCIEFGAGVGAVIMPIHPGTIGLMDIPVVHTLQLQELWDEVSDKKDKARKLTIDALKELGLYAQKFNVILALENVLHTEEIIQTPEHLKSILDSVNLPNVKALLDVGHSNRVGIDSKDFIKELGKDLCHVHFSDNDGTCDLHLPLGTSNINFENILFNLSEDGYKGAVIVEIGFKDEKEYIDSKRCLPSKYFK